jgi:hypothetical protein
MDDAALTRIRIAPNPTRGPIRIDIEGHAGTWQWELRDLAGKRVMAQGPGAQAGRSIVLDLSGLSAGSYLLVVEADGQRAQQRIVKH